MKLAMKARRRLALAILCVGTPLYIVAAATLIGRLERPGFLLELVLYAAAGIVWFLPFKPIFKGVGGRRRSRGSE